MARIILYVAFSIMLFLQLKTLHWSPTVSRIESRLLTRVKEYSQQKLYILCLIFCQVSIYTMPPGQANILECFESQLKCLELVPTRITAWIILSPWWIMWVDLHPPRQQVSWGSLSELSTAQSWFDWMRPGCVEKIHLILYLHVYPMFTPWNPRKSWAG